MTNIQQYGWNENWSSKWDEKWEETEDKRLVPGRIVGDFGSKYRVMTDLGETWGSYQAS